MMRRRVLLLVCLLTCATALPAQVDTEPTRGIREKSPDFVAFTGARVVVAPGKVIQDGTLVIRDGRVVSVGAAETPPAGTRVIELDGRSIYPGFIDPYTEYGLPPSKENEGPRFNRREPPQYEADRRGAQGWNAAIHAERRWMSRFAPNEEAAKALWKRGVTSVLALRMDGIFRGQGVVVSLTQEGANAAVLAPGPRGLSFDKGSSEQEYPSSQMGAIALIRQSLLDADWYQRAQEAWRRNPAQERPVENRALEALARYEGAFVFETPGALALLRAGEIGSAFDLDLIYVGSGYEYRWIDKVAALQAPLILPLTFPKEPSVASWEEALDVELALLRHWERAPTNPAVLAQHGVQLAFTGHGLRKGEEFFANLRRAINYGLDPQVALAALTTVPAEILGIADRAGTLEPGHRADMVITEGDLLSDEESKILAVWIGGRPAHHFVDLSAADFRGAWEFQLVGDSWRLELEGELGELKGSISAPGASDVDAKKINVVASGHDSLSFQAALGEDETTRFTLRRLGQRTQLRAALRDGRIVTDWLERAPQKQEQGTEEAARKEKDENPAEQLVSRLTQPPGAFGRTALPVPEEVLFRNATLWTNEEIGIIQGGDLLIRDGKIAAIGTDLEAPSGARVIDSSGLHLTPGMIDEHSHIAISGAVNEGSQASSAEVRIGDVVDPTDAAIYRALAGGTTTAQLLHGSANPIGGQAQVVKLRWGRGPEAMKFEAAPPTIKFALGENVKQSNWGDLYTSRYPQTRMGVMAYMRDRFTAALEYQEEWAEWRSLSESERVHTVPPRRNLELETLLEILEGERIVHCHSYVQSEILALIRLAEDFGFQIGTFTHALEGYKVAPEIAVHGAGASSFSDWWAYKFEVYDAIPGNACLLTQAGVVTSINSDSANLIRRLNTEAAKSVMHCGMDEQEALKLVTLNPAIQLGIEDRVGSLAVGKEADLVLWTGHPLSMHSRVRQTWVDGALYFSQELDERLRQADRKERQALVQKILARETDEKEDEKKKEDDGAPEEEPEVRDAA